MNISLTLPSPSLPVLSSNLTAEQQACVDFVKTSSGHLVMDSVAGSGKSFTLVQQCIAINHYFPSAIIACVMYNSKNVPEMERRMADAGVLKTTVGTVHKFSFSAYKEKHGYSQANKTKTSDAAEKWNKRYKLLFEDVASICRMVDLAKDTGLCVNSDDAISYEDWQHVIETYEISFKQENISLEKVVSFAQDVFYETINDTTSCGFSDMIAIPLYHDYPFRKYDFVLVDEAQDINRSRLLAITQMLKPSTGRLIAVGDRHQSIYAFTGADSKSLDNIKRHFSAHELSLTHHGTAQNPHHARRPHLSLHLHLQSTP